MNYIKELNAFHKWKLYNKTSAGEVALWRALLSLNNDCGWKKKFNVPNSILVQLTELSRQAVDDARKQLVEKGLIVYEKGEVGRAGIYQMMSFCQGEIDPALDDVLDTTLDTELDSSLAECLHIPKDKQKRRREGKKHPFLVYEENFGILKPILRDSLIAWCEELGDEMVMEAIKLAVQKGGRTFSYLEAILKEWAEAELKDMDQMQVYEKQKEKNKANTLPFKKQKRNQKAALFEELRREIGT